MFVSLFLVLLFHDNFASRFLVLSFHVSKSNIFCCLLLEIFDLIHHIFLLLLCCIVLVVHLFCNYNWLGSSDDIFVSFFGVMVSQYFCIVVFGVVISCVKFKLLCFVLQEIFDRNILCRNCYAIVLLCCFCFGYWSFSM